jgi:hypothetical protein
MSDLVRTLSDTPLPTILVLAGVLFWILAIAGSLAGKITVERGKQTTAGLVGTAFVALGLVLFFVPSNQSQTGKAKEVQTTGSPAPAPASPVPKQICSDAAGHSEWTVGDSTVYLKSQGGRRQFYFLEPSAELAKLGAQPCVQLFDGQKVNETYEGKVVVFAGRCGNGHSYDASGPITNSDGTVTLTGMAPQFDLNCNATGQQQKTLIFDLIHG